MCAFRKYKIQREGMLLSVLRETLSQVHRENGAGGTIIVAFCSLRCLTGEFKSAFFQQSNVK